MLKRLIEVALPLKEVSEQSAREKSIRHGHISTLHIWWARRPLAACRAAVFASLIPDPNDPECPEDFRKLVMDLLKSERFRPSSETNGQKPEDTPRNRCLEFIKHLVKWENSNNPEFIEPARKLIGAAHNFLHPGAEGDAPKVLDPFAGGGAIPLEALRLGCEAHAIDLNPVAHLIELCTLVYPQKYGQPDSRSVPDYIKRLIAHNVAKKKAEGGSTLFDKEDGEVVACEDLQIIPDVEITEAEYRRNPLAADVKYWGQCVLEKAKQDIGGLYPPGPDGSIRLAYLWANTLTCPNPSCAATVPLMTQRWLAKSPKRPIALGYVDAPHGVDFCIQEGSAIEGDPSEGTILRGAMRCPKCHQGMYDKNQIKKAVQRGIGLQPLCVVSANGIGGRRYELFTDADLKGFQRAKALHDALRADVRGSLTAFPNELVGTDYEWALTVSLFGLTTWAHQFNARQLVALAVFAKFVREALRAPADADEEYALAVRALLTMVHGRLADKCAIHCVWNAVGEKLEHVFGRQAISMSWDYGELNPFSGRMGDWIANLNWVLRNIESGAAIPNVGTVRRGSATRLPKRDGSLNAVLTDPPYYDSVPYADLSDFFYVWHKRCLAADFKDLYRTPVTPKAEELVQQSSRYTAEHKRRKTKGFFETGMKSAFAEVARVMTDSGVAGVMFAHKTTMAWEALIQGLQEAGLQVTSTWPIHTEMKARLRAKDSAALASSVYLVCRKRPKQSEVTIWDDVRKDLQQVARERLEFFWSQGIRGADFFISAIGPALSVFGKYERVTKLSGEEVTVGQFLDEVRSLVTSYALAKILKTSHTANIDPESRFYVVWKWSYGDAKVPADESFKLAQALGMHTENLWDRTGVLEKSGENVQAVAVAKRMKIKDLGEPGPDGSPASLVDVLHRMCVFRDKGDADGMAEFVARCGQGKNPAIWLVAQAVSEILPDGDKEKQLMQGLLNQREKLEHEQGLLF
jgi:adenine-specific DNA methylase